MTDQLVAETFTLQRTTVATDKRPCLRWNSNSRSQTKRTQTKALDRAATWTGTNDILFVEYNKLIARMACS
jgi:hypothetical protein